MQYSAYDYENSTVAYPQMLDHVIAHGAMVDTRLGLTRELSTAITLWNPLEMVPLVHGRHANHFGMLAEALWVLSDVNESELIGIWNSQLTKFSDTPDGKLYGAYGPRMIMGNDQIEEAVNVFERDGLGSRQVVISILNPDDVGVVTKDYPCNVMIMFKIRGPHEDAELNLETAHLNMTVINRSNDIHWGLFGVNFPQFALLQNYLAYRIGVKVGVQTHLSDSMHLYLESEPHKAITARMNNPVTVLLPDMRVFYDWLFSYRESGKPFDIFDHLDHKHQTVRNILSYCAENEAPTDVFGNSAFMLTAIPLLQLYAQWKKEKFSSREAMRLLNLRVLTSISGDIDDMREIPLHWIVACCETIMRRSKSMSAKDYDLLVSNGMYLIDQVTDLMDLSMPIPVETVLRQYLSGHVAEVTL